MNSAPKLDRPIPWSTATAERARLPAPRASSGLGSLPGVVMGNRAFMRAWAGRRAALARPLSAAVANPTRGARATFD